VALAQLARCALLLAVRVVDAAARSSELLPEDAEVISRALADVLGDGGLDYARWHAEDAVGGGGGGGGARERGAGGGGMTMIGGSTVRSASGGVSAAAGGLAAARSVVSGLGAHTSAGTSSLGGAAPLWVEEAKARRLRTEILGSVVGDRKWTHRIVVFLHLLLLASVEPSVRKCRALLARSLLDAGTLPFGLSAEGLE
jgi:hypothetical protein